MGSILEADGFVQLAIGSGHPYDKWDLQLGFDPGEPVDSALPDAAGQIAVSEVHTSSHWGPGPGFPVDRDSLLCALKRR